MKHKKSFIYYYNVYAPWRIARKYLARAIFRWADNKYGATARGEVNGFRVVSGVGVPNMTAEQQSMLKRWRFWMRIKISLYDVASHSLADRLFLLYERFKRTFSNS